MATYGTYEHTKVRAGLHDPEIACVPVIHFRVHSSILALPVPKLLILLVIHIIAYPCLYRQGGDGYER